MKDTLEKYLQAIVAVEKKIIAGELKKALVFARESALLPDPEALLVQMLARLNIAEKENDAALISDEALKIERATLTKQLLGFLKDLKRRVDQEITSIGDGDSSSTEDEKILILVLFAPEDKALWEQLEKHLFISLRDPALNIVDIRRGVPLSAPDTFAYQEQLIDEARVVLALVSPNILTFPMYPLAERAAAAGKLIPVRAVEMTVSGTPFHHEIKGLPADGRFVSQWPDANSAWVDVAKNLRDFFDKIKTEAS